MKKRGSHVGVMLSFVIFLTFFIFLYTIIEPVIRTQEDKQALSDYLGTELIKMSFANMTTFSIKINEDINQNKDCIKLKKIIGEVTDETDLIIKDEFGNILNYSVQGQDLNIGTGYFFNGFLRIYYSEEFEPFQIFTGIGCDSVSDISVGLMKTEKNVFITKIINLIDRYENSYEDLKDELKVPPGSEFSFSFTQSNGTIIGVEDKEVSTNIYSEDVPVQYINKEGNFLSGFFNIKVW